MGPRIFQKPFALALVSGFFILSGPIWAQTPAPTAVSFQPQVQATPRVSSKPQAKKKDPASPISRKPTLNPHHAPTLSLLGLSYNSEFSGPLLDYNKLNADLYPILSDQPHSPTADEKFWGTVAGAAGYGIAGAAAAQAVGLLPSERTEKKK